MTATPRHLYRGLYDPVRDLLTALRDVAEQRGIGLIEAERLVMPDRKPDLVWIDEAAEITPEVWAALTDYARRRMEPPKVVKMEDYRK